MLLRDMLSLGYPDQLESPAGLPESSLLDEAMSLHSAIAEGLRSFEQPYEDVYEAAVRMTLHHRYWTASDYYYRGQCRREWADHVEPSIFRPENPNWLLSEEELQDRLNQLSSFSDLVERNYPGQYATDQRIAIAQHYGVKTWLVDLTTDAWVALFFASHGGRQGDVGILQRFSVIEWSKLSAAGSNALGEIKLIEVFGVRRIAAQKALFLDTSHPELVDQYVAETLQFYQHDGLPFQSQMRTISEEALLSDQDPFAVLVDDWKHQWKANAVPPFDRLDPTQVKRADRPLQRDDYLNIVLSWFKDREVDTDSEQRYPSEEVLEELRWLCSIHAAVQRQRSAIPNYKRSIHLLRGAVETILAGYCRDVILEDYAQAVGPLELATALRQEEGPLSN
jgi:hypothetical protein